MLFGGLGFFACGASAAVLGWLAIDFLEERAAAVGHAGIDDAQRTGFADGGASGPIDEFAEQADLA